MERAITLIGQKVGEVVARSHFIETEPWGFESENKFLNACIKVSTTHSPHDCLLLTQQIERQLGRTAKSQGGQYHDRPIDIDLLLYDDLHLTLPDLVLPHPLMHERDFVMRPLREVMRLGGGRL